ncbi:hypothetical protein ABIB06_006529 [Bradyrhizobium sp. LB8.2]|uniref:hypothetical protein n=1 Tax=unclassified Bradyrhizobium TaxID=2631580 RepID=UPI003398822D
MSNGKGEDNRKREVTKNQTFSLPETYEEKVTKLWKKTGLKTRTAVAQAAFDLFEQETFNPRPDTKSFEQIGLVGVLQQPHRHDFTEHLRTAQNVFIALTDFRTWLGQHGHLFALQSRSWSDDRNTTILAMNRNPKPVPEIETIQALESLFPPGSFQSVKPASFSIRRAPIVATNYFLFGTDTECWVTPTSPVPVFQNVSYGLHFVTPTKFGYDDARSPLNLMSWTTGFAWTHERKESPENLVYAWVNGLLNS